MPLSIDELVAKYLITDTDRPDHPAYPSVPTFVDSSVTPLIDGTTYFHDLLETIYALSGPSDQQGIYLAGWEFHADFEFLVDGSPIDVLETLLVSKATAGADVRILIWINDVVLSPPPTRLPTLPLLVNDIPDISAAKVQILKRNMNALRRLRSFLPLRDRVIANTLDHALGAAHMKFALVFDSTQAVAYTGGIDFARNRYSKDFHLEAVDKFGVPAYWHDVQAKLQGPVTQACYEFYRSLWNELAASATQPQSPPSFRVGSEIVAGTPQASTLIPSGRSMPAFSDAIGTLQRVQSLRTVPKRQSGIWPLSESPISFAPEGIFEIQLALKKAIANAENYIYVEDQQMEGREIFKYLKAAVQAKPNLRVIMLTGQTDPADPPTDTRALALRQYLTDGLSAGELERIVFFSHRLAVIHSKVWVIDDAFAFIGSANIYNRALFTEIEHGISFVHTGTVNEVTEFRKQLWGEHFRLDPANRFQLHSWETALTIWNPSWIPPGSASLPTFTLPVHTNDPTRFNLPWRLDIDPDLNETPSLDYFAIPWVDNTGTQIEETRDGQTYVVIRDSIGRRVLKPKTPGGENIVEPRPPGTLVAVGIDFVEDNSLPLSDVVQENLIGNWVRIGIGPAASHVRRITGHIDHRIFFDPLPFVPSLSGFEYALLTPILKPITLPPVVAPLSLLWPHYYFLIDLGEPPL